MSNTFKQPPFLPIILDPLATLSLHRQLYEGLRSAILSGQLVGVLPSTRSFASHLQVSRTTVITAYDQLRAEGYIESHIGAGTFVTHTLPDRTVIVRDERVPPSNSAQAGRHLAQRAKHFPSAQFKPHPEPIRPPLPNAFPPGIPAMRAFPTSEWQQLVRHRIRDSGSGNIGYSESAGYGPLREALSRYLNLSRAVHCTPDQIVITTGAQQALSLAAQLLLDVGDNAWIEDPCYIGARRALIGAGATLVHVPVDSNGIAVSEGKKLCANARVAYVTPSHQFPLGMTMKLSRRLALLEWASQEQSWIIEDDYDSELSFSGRPLPSLQGLDTNNRVIYIGTFSKVLFPALRLGYMVVPPDLVDTFISAHVVTGGQPAALEQMVTADFITDGGFERHIRRMRTLYAQRHAVFLDCARQLDSYCHILPTESGMHVVAMLDESLSGSISDLDAVYQASAYGINVPPLSLFSHTKLQGLLFGFAASDPETIQEGVSRLAVAFRNLAHAAT